MPGVYKEKECPECKNMHRKRGIFCSQRCAAYHKTLDLSTKEKISNGLKEYYATPEGIAQAAVNNRRVLSDRIGDPHPVTIDEFVVDIPELPDYDILEGYERGENW